MATPSIPTIVRVSGMLFQHRFYLVDSLGALLEQHLVVMAAESIWPGVFQAKAGRGNAAIVRSTKDAISDTVASYAISDEQGARKKVLDNRQ
jgi:hypothetical protein